MCVCIYIYKGSVWGLGTDLDTDDSISIHNIVGSRARAWNM